MPPGVAYVRPHYSKPPGAYHLDIPKSDSTCSWQAGGTEVYERGLILGGGTMSQPPGMENYRRAVKWYLGYY